MKGLLFTYGLTYGGALVSLFNPFYGLLVYICFAILIPPALWHWSVPLGNYSQVVAIAFLSGWAIHGFGDRSFGKAKPILYALLGYALWVVLSTAFAIESDRGWPFAIFLFKIVVPVIAGVTLVQTWHQLQLLMWTIFGSCSLLAYEANLAYLQGHSVERDGFRALDNNTFSILMACGFGIAIVLSLEERGLIRRMGYFFFAAAMAHVPMLSFSRGGMLGAGAAYGTALVLTPKTPRAWCMIWMSVLAGGVLVGPTVVDEFASSFAENLDGSAESRVILWGNCLDVAIKHPVFGVGQDCWGIVVADYGWPTGKEAHSLWFQTMAELGFPGVGFLASFYALAAISSWRARNDTNHPLNPILVRAVCAGLAGFGVSAAFVTVDGIELPFYVALLGACAVKLRDSTSVEFEEDWELDSHALGTSSFVHPEEAYA
jgi:putative inorganic carbon (HCO3(-)) transporter